VISKKIIKEITRRLVKTYDPREIYLFGSYAWGKPNDDSDLDVLIVVDECKSKTSERTFPASIALKDLLIAKDVIVYTKKEFEERVEDVTTLLYRIKDEGELLYAKS
jgi:uncharacterized protein